MAKEWAKKFYNSGAWISVRRIVLRRDHYTCADCYRRATEVHHIIELSPDNINDNRIALNPDNLISLCHECHDKRTKDIGDLPEGYYFDEGGHVIMRQPPPVKR